MRLCAPVLAKAFLLFPFFLPPPSSHSPPSFALCSLASPGSLYSEPKDSRVSGQIARGSPGRAGEAGGGALGWVFSGRVWPL